jgi:predicted alpha-1,2-mannosidase
MKQLIILLLLATGAYAENDYTQYVDPFVGTGGHGHTFPGPTLPFGMVQLGPDTRLDTWDGCSGYHHEDSLIYGFSHTHLSGTGCSDYADVLLMPTLGTPMFQSKEYASTYDMKSEKATVGYYSVMLNKNKIKVELAATTRSGLHKYTFPKSSQANVILDLNHRDSLIKGEITITGDSEISGLRLSHGWADNQYVYYVIQFSKPFKKFGILKGKTLLDNTRTATAAGSGLKGYVSFDTKEGEVIYARVGISAVSVEGARKNLQAEQQGWDFDKLVADAKTAWNKELGKIEIESPNASVMRTFYSALYHSMMAPNIYQDVDGQYRGRDLKVHTAKNFNYYTVFSLWDTYRAEHPMLTLIDKKRSSDFINTFITEYEQGGRLPVWELSSCETNCMIGYHSVPVITEAYLKGVTGFDANKAFEAMKHSAMEDRNGLKDYKKYGYIKMKDDGENVSKTLEYAYDDWCIAQFAKKLGKAEDYNYFIKRAQNYKNLYDKQTKFMRPRQEDFKPNFDPYEVDNNYTEGNAWQYSFYVPQDISGQMKLMGGKEQLATMLDSVFGTSSVLRGHAQDDISGMIGQYAHGNEPSHQIAYEYDYVGQPWKTQAMIRRIDNELYRDQPDGLAGNEDCGQMSAWYVLSALGIYEVCPGSDQYAIGSPLAEKAVIHLENGKTFTIKAKHNKKENVYIASAKLNGADYTRSYLTYEDIAKGGEIEFEMSDKPNKNWGSSDADVPVTKIE